jgi:PAS domain S-box-containing protein
MGPRLRLLMVEDSKDDADLIQNVLRLENFEIVCEVVDTPAAMRAALENQEWDVITSDHAMPHFSAPAALALAREVRPDVPFIIVSGEIDLNLAVSLLRGGALDYIQKGKIARLAPAIEREIREVELRRERRQIKKALQISETRYRRLFETAQDGILILDADTGLVIDVNPFLIQLLGYSKEEFLGKKLWELGAFKDIEASKFAYHELQRTGYIRYDHLPLQTVDGSDVAVEFVSNVYLVDRTNIAQCNIRDITSHERAAREILKLNAELEQRVQERTNQLEILNKELETFNYSVSHDLRAPLRRIISYAKILKEGGATKQCIDNLGILENIRVSAEHMNTLISALLKLARFWQGQLIRQPVDLTAMVHLITAELQLSQVNRQVEFVIPDNIQANGDGPLLGIVLENLIGNAWKFTSQRGAARIEFGTATQANGSTAYFVRDDGTGFDMTYADKLFGAFQRLHNEAEFPGIGIGLATVQRIIHRHGGRVWAEGLVNQGATVYFTVDGV